MTCNELTRKRLNHSHLEIVRHDCGHHDGHLCTCKPDFINCPNLVRKIIYIFVIFRIFRDIIWLLFRQWVRVQNYGCLGCWPLSSPRFKISATGLLEINAVPFCVKQNSLASSDLSQWAETCHSFGLGFLLLIACGCDLGASKICPRNSLIFPRLSPSYSNYASWILTRQLNRAKRNVRNHFMM